MPYNIRKQSCKQSSGKKGSYVLSYKDKKGKKHRACHTSRKKARGQIAAIEAEGLERNTMKITITELRRLINEVIEKLSDSNLMLANPDLINLVSDPELKRLLSDPGLARALNVLKNYGSVHDKVFKDVGAEDYEFFSDTLKDIVKLHEKIEQEIKNNPKMKPQLERQLSDKLLSQDLLNQVSDAIMKINPDSEFFKTRGYSTGHESIEHDADFSRNSVEKTISSFYMNDPLARRNMINAEDMLDTLKSIEGIKTGSQMSKNESNLRMMIRNFILSEMKK